MDTTAKSSQGPLQAASPFIRVWVVRVSVAMALAVAAMILEALAANLFGDAVDNVASMRAFDETPGAVFTYLSALLVAPLLETLVMAWLILLMLERLSVPVVVVLSGLLWGAIHLAGNPTGWVMFFSFALYSYVFIARRQEPNCGAFILVAMAHFFHNLIVAIAATGAGIISWKV